MTEAEAKTKWCPFSGYRPGAATPEMCIASQCMAWRWVVSNEYQMPADPKGYCGMAGGPG